MSYWSFSLTPAQQISKKSSAFFSAVSTQDKVAEKVTHAIEVVKRIKYDINHIHYSCGWGVNLKL